LSLHSWRRREERPVADPAECPAGRGRSSCRPRDWANDLIHALGRDGLLECEFCGLVTPELALDLCDWLDATATAAVQHAGAGGREEAVAGGFPAIAARRILGEGA
jgi:hypothetical protein